MSTDEDSLSPNSDSIPETGRVIGIDFGTARIGVAARQSRTARWICRWIAASHEWRSEQEIA